MGPSWGSFSVMLAPFSAQVAPRTVFEPSYLRKSDCSRNITFSNGFGPKLTSRWGQDRPKIAPRRVQDRLGWLFCLLIFRVDFCVFWIRFWCRFGLPNGSRGGPLSCANRPVGGPRRSWDRLGSVLFSSCAPGSLFGAHRVPLGVVLNVLGLVFCHLGLSWARFRSSWALLGSFLGYSV